MNDIQKGAPPSYSNPGYQSPQPGYNNYQQYNVQPGPIVTNQPMGLPPNTTIIQSVTEVITSQPGKTWQTKHWCCGNSCKTCMCVWFNPCYQCALSTRMNEHCCIGCVICPGGLASMRAVIRTRHNIEGTLCADHCASYWCRPCVMIQLSNEMDYIGYPEQNCCCQCCSC